MMNSRRLWCYALLIVFGLYLLYLSIDTGPGRQPLLGALRLSPSDEPLFRFDDPYFNGRSRWMARQFELGRASLSMLAVPIKPAITPHVHEEPFTAGDWIASLDVSRRVFRAEAERNAMDTQVTFFVPGVRPEKLALFLGCSGFLENVGEPGEYSHSILIDPANEATRDSERNLSLAGAQFLSREIWTGGSLAMPTGVYYFNELARSDEAVAFLYEFWSNSPVDGAAEVLFACGQFALRAEDGGTLVLLRSFFRGQSFSAWLKGFAISATKRFYLKYVGVIQKQAPDWIPEERIARWAGRVGWTWE